jgi:hypothetical protein
VPAPKTEIMPPTEVAAAPSGPSRALIGGGAGILIACLAIVGALDFGHIGPFAKASTQQPQSLGPVSNQTNVAGGGLNNAQPGADTAPKGPLTLNWGTPDSADGSGKCHYRLFLSVGWPQNPPYKTVEGKTMVVALTGPGLPATMSIVLNGAGGETVVDPVAELTKANLGTFTIAVQTIDGKPASDYIDVNSPLTTLTASAVNPCANIPGN